MTCVAAAEFGCVRRDQQIVDEVADELQRPVVLEDERHSLIAYSAHAHTIRCRQQALLLRQTPPEPIAWVTEHLDAYETGLITPSER